MILIIGFAAILGFLVYRAVHPGIAQESVNPSHFLLPWLDVSWMTSSGDEITGWYVAGMKGAPGILLAPGYGLSRSDAMSLVSSLHSAGYHVLVYTQRGFSASPRRASSLGLHEKEDMDAALAFLKLRPGIDNGHLGIWGVDEGARAALAVAAAHPEVRAIAADTPYEYVLDVLSLKVREELGFHNSLIESGCRVMFRLWQIRSFRELVRPLPVQALADRSILFIQGANRMDMAPLTASLYDRVQPQKEMVSVPSSRSPVMTSEEVKNYDQQVSNFFRANLAIAGGS
jgi:pimeloyl-ACP methyl ester carboxylesterase